MKNKTKERGITLISLIVTIIILVIVAVVAILSVVNNGVLDLTGLSKVANIQKTVKEEIGLGCSTINLVIGEAAARDNSYSAVYNSDLIQKTLIDVLNQDIMHLNGKFSDGGKQAGKNQSEIIVEYEGNDYKLAHKDEYAKLIYTINVKQRSVEIGTETVFTSADIDFDGMKQEELLEAQKNKNILQQYLNLSKNVAMILLIVCSIILVIIIVIIMIVLKNSEIKKEKLTEVNMIKMVIREKLVKVCSSIKLEKINNNNLPEKDYIEFLRNIVIEKLNDPKNIVRGKLVDKYELDGEFKPSDEEITDTINIYYVGQDYCAACKNPEAKINYVITIEEFGLNVVKENSTIIAN